MSEKSKGDTSRIVKNPLLSASVTGLTFDDFTHNALLLPAAPPIEKPHQDDVNFSKEPQVTVTVGKKLDIDTTTFSEINLNPSIDEGLPLPEPTNFDIQLENTTDESLLFQAASSFSQLPSVASSVFSTFSKVLKDYTPTSGQSRETSEDKEVVKPENPPAIAVCDPFPVPTQQLENQLPVEAPTFYSPANIPKPSISSTPAASNQNSYRLTSKKKIYAQVPGLSANVGSVNQPTSTFLPSSTTGQRQTGLNNYHNLPTDFPKQLNINEPPTLPSASTVAERDTEDRGSGLFSFSNFVPPVLQNLTGFGKGSSDKDTRNTIQFPRPNNFFEVSEQSEEIYLGSQQQDHSVGYTHVLSHQNNKGEGQQQLQQTLLFNPTTYSSVISQAQEKSDQQHLQQPASGVLQVESQEHKEKHQQLPQSLTIAPKIPNENVADNNKSAPLNLLKQTLPPAPVGESQERKQSQPLATSTILFEPQLKANFQQESTQQVKEQQQPQSALFNPSVFTPAVSNPQQQQVPSFFNPASIPTETLGWQKPKEKSLKSLFNPISSTSSVQELQNQQQQPQVSPTLYNPLAVPSSGSQSQEFKQLPQQVVTQDLSTPLTNTSIDSSPTPRQTLFNPLPAAPPAQGFENFKQQPVIPSSLFNPLESTPISRPSENFNQPPQPQATSTFFDPLTAKSPQELIQQQSAPQQTFFNPLVVSNSEELKKRQPQSVVLTPPQTFFNPLQATSSALGFESFQQQPVIASSLFNPSGNTPIAVAVQGSNHSQQPQVPPTFFNPSTGKSPPQFTQQQPPPKQPFFNPLTGASVDSGPEEFKKLQETAPPSLFNPTAHETSVGSLTGPPNSQQQPTQLFAGGHQDLKQDFQPPPKPSQTGHTVSNFRLQKGTRHYKNALASTNTTPGIFPPTFGPTPFNFGSNQRYSPPPPPLNTPVVALPQVFYPGENFAKEVRERFEPSAPPISEYLSTEQPSVEYPKPEEISSVQQQTEVPFIYSLDQNVKGSVQAPFGLLPNQTIKPSGEHSQGINAPSNLQSQHRPLSVAVSHQEPNQGFPPPPNQSSVSGLFASEASQQGVIAHTPPAQLDFSSGQTKPFDVPSAVEEFTSDIKPKEILNKSTVQPGAIPSVSSSTSISSLTSDTKGGTQESSTGEKYIETSSSTSTYENIVIHQDQIKTTEQTVEQLQPVSLFSGGEDNFVPYQVSQLGESLVKKKEDVEITDGLQDSKKFYLFKPIDQSEETGQSIDSVFPEDSHITKDLEHIPTLKYVASDNKLKYVPSDSELNNPKEIELEQEPGQTSDNSPIFNIANYFSNQPSNTFDNSNIFQSDTKVDQILDTNTSDQINNNEIEVESKISNIDIFEKSNLQQQNTISNFFNSPQISQPTVVDSNQNKQNQNNIITNNISTLTSTVPDPLEFFNTFHQSEYQNFNDKDSHTESAAINSEDINSQSIQNFFNNPPQNLNNSVNDLNYNLISGGIVASNLQNLRATGVRGGPRTSSPLSTLVEPPSSACSEISTEVSSQFSGTSFYKPVITNYTNDTNEILDPEILELFDMSTIAENNMNANTNVAYRPVTRHWFYKKVIDNKQIWTPFSYLDSHLIEEHFLEEGGGSIVPVEGGRYDVNIADRTRIPIFWSGDATEVRRCSWFYKAVDSRYIPYEEAIADILEEEYKNASITGEWHRKVPLPTGESVVFHGPTVMVHFLQSQTPDSWSSSSQTTARPRVVKRDIEEFSIEEGESKKVDHILFMVHGIGSACDLKFRKVEEVVDEFRCIATQLVQSHYKNSKDTGDVGRVEVLPVSWHSELHSEESGIDKRLRAITLESIPKLRNFANDTLLDVLFYTSPVFCQSIMDTVAGTMNKVYIKYCQRNPDFKGAVSLAGHSLGSLILFDLLYHQKRVDETDVQNSENPDQNIEPMEFCTEPVSDTSMTTSKQISYTMGPAGTGQPYINYPQLLFAPKKFFALGSPIGMFVTIRGIDALGLHFKLPTCSGFYNIFHPYDPVAYRIEALVNPDLASLRPVLIPHHKGRKRMHLELKETMTRVGADIKQKIFDTFRNTVDRLTIKHKTDPKEIEKEVDKVLDIQLKLDTEPQTEQRSRLNSISTQSDIDSGETDLPLGQLNASRRIDYVLQEAPLEFFNEYLFALTSHVCYWDSEDTILFIIKEIYSSIGIRPDSQIPQQNMTIERPSSRGSYTQSSPTKHTGSS